ncbi:MAG: NAD(P)/FAD-dependent oxidoreductase [Phycisphaerales bacterium]
MASSANEFDVAIVGGGPAGSTAGVYLKKLNPDLRVGVFEMAKFPREHVGESQLPTCGFYLDEMGCWDKMEAANFPIKIGATYRWGQSPEPWDFEFLPPERLDGHTRPGRYEGPRRLTAWQVDRAVYDDILLRHAEELGCEVFEETRVAKAHRDGDTIERLDLSTGEQVTAKWYLDGSGHRGVLRRALGVKSEAPTTLMNIAFWDYWEDAEWAVTIGAGGTRVQVMSIGDGWLWFIPISPTRTSVGYICPVEHYKKRGKSPEEMYTEAIAREPRISKLLRKARRDGETKSTSDWSFIAERLTGPNWFLIGESAGFADPILAGGLTLTHGSARAAAHMIVAIERGEHDAEWLQTHYDESERRRIMRFIRFADFWYASNGLFSDLQEHCASIASETGMKMTPNAAFRWLSLGGFTPEDGARPGIGGLDLGAVKIVTGKFTTDQSADWELNKYNTFRLNLVGAKKDAVPLIANGRIERVEGYRRGPNRLPLAGAFGVMHDILKRHSDMLSIGREVENAAKALRWLKSWDAMAALETMLIDRWVIGKVDKRKPMPKYLPEGPDGKTNFHPNEDPHPNLNDRVAAS